MKTIAIIAGVILLCLGIVVATGIEANPAQAIIALPCIAVGAICLRIASRPERKPAQREKQIYRVYNYATGQMDIRVA